MIHLFCRRALWVYLGWSSILYIDGNSKAEISRATIHFYARGEELKERKWECANRDYWLLHDFIQQAVIPWQGGDNLWAPIHNPSENLKEWTKADCGYEYKDHRWHKLAEHIAANVLKFPAKDSA